MAGSEIPDPRPSAEGERARAPGGFAPGSLLAAVERTTRDALESGALCPIGTAGVEMEDRGVRFCVRTLTGGANRPDRPPGSTTRNPFLDPDPRLTVARVGESHLVLLNKFPVVEHHTLIVTRRFEEQRSPLDLADFEALATCMAEYDALAFYNSGQRAGASQRHKHLQMVPLPMGPGDEWLPVERRMVPGAGVDALQLEGIRHGYFALEHSLTGPRGAREAHEHYRECLAELSLDPSRDAYNLLATRGWLLLVPRSRESWRGISVNALGFAGALLVEDPDASRRLESAGPWSALQGVSFVRE